jgi:stage V sporulation protein B
MSKAADMAKVSAKGSFHLLWGLILSTAISSIGTIFIARLLGSDNYGLYAIVLAVPNMVGIFRDWGVSVAMTRCAAQYRAENRLSELRSILAAGLIFELAMGLILTLVSFLLAGFLATTVFQRPAIAPLIEIASFSVLLSALTGTALSIFTGMERMEFTSIVWVIQAIVKTFVIIALVILGFGTGGAIIGYTAGVIVSGVVGGLFILMLYRQLPKPVSVKLEIKAYITEMLRYGIPMSLSGLIGAFVAQYYIFLLPIYYVTTNVPIGNYGVAQNFVILITFFATPITTILFPAFSKLDPKTDQETLKKVFRYSVKYASVLVVPVAVLVMCLSGPAVATLFGNTYASAPLFLALLAISYIYTALGSLSATNLITSQGETRFFLYLTLITAAIGLPLGYALIMSLGVLGLIATSLTASIPSLVISLHFIKKRYSVSIDWNSSAKILIASAVTATLTYLIITQLVFSSWIRLGLGTFIFLLILIPAMLVTKAIDETDLSSMQSMASGLGFIGKIVDLVLKILKKLTIK